MMLPAFHPVLEEVKIPVKRGRKRTRPKEVVVDKAYIRKGLRQRGIKGMIAARQLRPGTKRRKKGLIIVSIRPPIRRAQV